MQIKSYLAAQPLRHSNSMHAFPFHAGKGRRRSGPADTAAGHLEEGVRSGGSSAVRRSGNGRLRKTNERGGRLPGCVGGDLQSRSMPGGRWDISCKGGGGRQAELRAQFGSKPAPALALRIRTRGGGARARNLPSPAWTGCSSCAHGARPSSASRKGRRPRLGGDRGGGPSPAGPHPQVARTLVSSPRSNGFIRSRTSGCRSRRDGIRAST